MYFQTKESTGKLIAKLEFVNLTYAENISRRYSQFQVKPYISTFQFDICIEITAKIKFTGKKT